MELKLSNDDVKKIISTIDIEEIDEKLGSDRKIWCR